MAAIEEGVVGVEGGRGVGVVSPRFATSGRVEASSRLAAEEEGARGGEGGLGRGGRSVPLAWACST
jgi:hypothetical protein